MKLLVHLSVQVRRLMGAGIHRLGVMAVALELAQDRRNMPSNLMGLVLVLVRPSSAHSWIVPKVGCRKC